ncbi:MAG: NAD-dependent epimerase/dehydratase family protein [Solirubrobacterales bacterium]
MAGRRILITGIADHWATELARRLERDPTVEFIAGVDSEPPAGDLDRTEYIEADLRSPLLNRLLPATEPDTVVHCGILWYPAPGKPARALHDINVIGSLQLLAACEKAPTVERVIVRGSAAIYGCEGASPSFFTEDMARKFPLRTRFQRDISELENYFETFSRRRADVICTMLRFQPEIGPGLDNPLSRYLSLPAVPVQLGYDPRLQLVHAEDATGALLAATMKSVRGPVNVAPSGSISLTRLLRLAGRPQIPIPTAVFGPALSRLGRRSLGAGEVYNDALRLLRYGRGVDNTRLREEIGYEFRYDAVAGAKDFAEKTRGRSVVPLPGLGSLTRRFA